MKRAIRFILAWTMGLLLLPFALFIPVVGDTVEWLTNDPSSKPLQTTREVAGGWWSWASFK